MTAHISIGLIMATYIEAKPFVEKITWQRSDKNPFPVYCADNLTLVVSGMGKANAAAACAWLCTARTPGCIINIGAAGANTQGMPVGSIHHITEALETDRRHFKTGEPFRHRPDVLEGFPTARVATRDEPVIDPQERQKISFYAELSDMEGSAVVQAARRFQTPCFLFKFVSDTRQDTTGDRIAANIRLYRDPVFNFFMNLRAMPIKL
ncbi:MAG: hypothetical protein ACLFQ9_03240 [Desulfobacterales bacterium]